MGVKWKQECVKKRDTSRWIGRSEDRKCSQGKISTQWEKKIEAQKYEEENKQKHGIALGQEE